MHVARMHANRSICSEETASVRGAEHPLLENGVRKVGLDLPSKNAALTARAVGWGWKGGPCTVVLQRIKPRAREETIRPDARNSPALGKEGNPEQAG